ncbi:hypothetical protein [Streptomyces sp. CC210A]|uniref:hypothetical protein n=1 Tax=Streptomyces sp. CC210A TaxID=2898184 RepID=UPI001F1E24D3|nr:hypothetical protein [Streptomyces sp. CC210A]
MAPTAPDTGGTVRPRIVYVHGSGPKPRPELLKAQWDRALFGRDLGGESHLAYWAPVLHGEPLPDPVPDPLEGTPDGSVETRGEEGAEEGSPRPPVLEDPAQFMARTATEARSGDAGGGVARSAGGGALGGWLRDMTYLAEALALAEEPRPGPGEEPLPEALPLPRPARTALFRRLVKHTFEDAHAYFFGGAGRAVRQAVAEALDAAGADADGAGPLVVVGHSLGSVAAYEVLAARNPRVDLFVTLGSPLAVTEVQDCLAAPPAVPSRTARWLNASDGRDVVALDHTLRPEYAPPGRITDLLVSNGSENHHGVLEYLADALVRDPVRRAWTRPAPGGD